MKMKVGILKFINGQDDRGDSYIDIPLDKPIFSFYSFKGYDSIEIIDC